MRCISSIILLALSTFSKRRNKARYDRCRVTMAVDKGTERATLVWTSQKCLERNRKSPALIPLPACLLVGPASTSCSARFRTVAVTRGLGEGYLTQRMCHTPRFTSDNCLLSLWAECSCSYCGESSTSRSAGNNSWTQPEVLDLGVQNGERDGQGERWAKLTQCQIAALA